MSDTETELRALDEEFDTEIEVALNPCGAWQAIQTLAAENATLRAHLEAARAALEHAKHNMPHSDQMVDDVLALIDRATPSTEGGE